MRDAAGRPKTWNVKAAGPATSPHVPRPTRIFGSLPIFMLYRMATVQSITFENWIYLNRQCLKFGGPGSLNIRVHAVRTRPTYVCTRLGTKQASIPYLSANFGQVHFTHSSARAHTHTHTHTHHRNAIWKEEEEKNPRFILQALIDSSKWEMTDDVPRIKCNDIYLSMLLRELATRRKNIAHYVILRPVIYYRADDKHGSMLCQC